MPKKSEWRSQNEEVRMKKEIRIEPRGFTSAFYLLNSAFELLPSAFFMPC
jgi:hypothetical protein